MNVYICFDTDYSIFIHFGTLCFSQEVPEERGKILINLEFVCNINVITLLLMYKNDIYYSLVLHATCIHIYAQYMMIDNVNNL